jgi:hypothetical protein
MTRVLKSARTLRLSLACAGFLLLAACGKTPAPAPSPAGAVRPAAAVSPKATPPTSAVARKAPADPKKTAPADTGDKASKAPQLEVAKTTVHVGDITRGEKAVHTFVLKNVGTDTLHIKKAKGS